VFDDRNFLQIGSDGSLLESPVNLDQLELAPAERAEIVVQFNPGESLKLLSIGRPSSFTEFPGAMSRMMRSLNAQNFDILSLSADPQLDDNGEIPRQLTSIYRLPESNATNLRSFLLSMGAGMRSGGDRGPGTGMRNGLGGGYGGGNFTINGRRMEENFINERIRLNTTEIWELNNNLPVVHMKGVHHGRVVIQFPDFRGVKSDAFVNEIFLYASSVDGEVSTPITSPQSIPHSGAWTSIAATAHSSPHG
jgi:FtsP/CotA-like multicopper oxidase with cupredoxin domain